MKIKKSSLLRYFLLSALIIGCGSEIMAQLSVPDIISSNMILQHGQPVPVWGRANPGEKITVSFANRSKSVKTAADSTWCVMLDPMEPSAKPRVMTINSRTENLTLDNIVVGEVWLASGQSNMEYSMQRSKAFAAPRHGEDITIAEMSRPANPMIRIYVARRKGPQAWAEASGESLPDVSAAGYYFAKTLQDSLNVPVGIITATLGGTRIETWTPVGEYNQSPRFAVEIKSTGKIQGVTPGSNYNRFIKPLIPYGIRGCIWYQGENNCGIGDTLYTGKYAMMVNSWRREFKNPDMPFFNVLLAPHVYSDRMHRDGKAQSAESLPKFREQQKTATAIIPATEYVSVSDLVDDIYDIHPSYKWIVGKRLADVALSKTYGHENIEYSGPRLVKVTRDGSSLVATFSHVTGGLTTIEGKRIRWFEIAGDDGIFHHATAEISSPESVTVSSENVDSPRYLRMGWHEMAEPNLINGVGLPAIQFAATEAQY